jgi:hypothetical protein
MRRLNTDIPKQLVAEHQPPCISIYMPVVTAFPGEMENSIRLKDLGEKLRVQSQQAFSKHDVQPLLEKIRSLDAERGFWAGRKSGLAIFCSPDLFEVVDLPVVPPQLVVVADSFHIKPLVRMLQAAGDEYEVLCLTRKDVRLLHGNRDRLQEVPLKNVPKTIFEAFGEEVNTPSATQKTGAGTPNATGRRPVTPEAGVMDTERFFRVIDKAIWDNHSRNSGVPLILATLEENQTTFRRISKNQHLIEQGIVIDPNHVSLERLREEAWRIIEPHTQQRLRQLVDAFEHARAHDLGSAEVTQVAEAAANGRVDTLLLDPHTHVRGTVDRSSGQVQSAERSNATSDDLLDDTAEIVLRNGGQVLVLPPEMMPTDTGLAAIFRY